MSPPTSPLMLFFISLVLPVTRPTHPTPYLPTHSLTHSFTRPLCLSAHPHLTSSGPEPINCTCADRRRETACARRSDAVHTVTVRPISKQRVEYAPQTRARACFVTGNRDWGGSPENYDILYTVLLYPQMDGWLILVLIDARTDTDGWTQSAWQRRLRILSAFF